MSYNFSTTVTLFAAIKLRYTCMQIKRNETEKDFIYSKSKNNSDTKKVLRYCACF